MDIIEWETEALSMIESRTLNPSIIRGFRTFSEQLVKDTCLSPPNADETFSYLNDFAPGIINEILNSGSIPANMESEYNSILTGFCQVAAIFLTTKCDRFLDAAMKIIGNMGSVFYQSSHAGMIGKEPVLYSKNVQAFAKMQPLERFESFWNKDISAAKVRQVATWLLPAGDYFGPGERSKWGLFVANKLCEMISNLTLRDLDEKEFDAAFAMVTAFVPETVKRMQAQTMHGQFALKLAKSEMLSKQICGMSRLSVITNDNPNLCGILQRDQFLEFFLNGELHHELVGYFAEIMKAMLNSNCATPFQVKLFWELVIRQHQSIVETYLKSFSTVIEGRMDLFVHIFTEMETVPMSALDLLRKLSFKWPKEALAGAFEKLWGVYEAQETSISEEQRENLIQTMKMFVPVNDQEACQKIQDRCLEMLTKGVMPELTLQILEKALRTVSDEKAREFLNTIIPLVGDNGVNYLEVLVIIFRQLETKLSESDFESVLQICHSLIENHSHEVCEFLTRLTDTACSKVPLMDQNMLLLVLQFLCSAGQKVRDVRVLVQKIRTDLNGGDAYGPIGLDALWEMFFQTGNSYIQEDLITTYTKGKFERPIYTYLDKCIHHLDCVRALKAIIFMLDFMDDGVNESMNKFYFDDDFCQVTLVGDANVTVSVKKDIAYNGFVRILANKFATTTTNIVLSNLDGSVIHAKNFSSYMKKETVISVGISYPSSGVVAPACNSESPVMLLSDEHFSAPLMKVLSESDPDLAPLALTILNKIPTQESERRLLDGFDADDFYCIDMPYLLIYRVHMLANFLRKNPSFMATFISENGMCALINIVINMAHDLFQQESSSSMQIFLVRAVNWILQLGNAQEFKDTIIKATQHDLSGLLRHIESLAICDDSSLEAQFITLLKYYGDCVTTTEGFLTAVKKTMFHRSSRIRRDICDIVLAIPNEDNKRELIVELLEGAKNSKCTEYFSMICKFVKVAESVNEIWAVVLKTLYSNFQMPERDNIIEVLKFRPPPQNFTNGIFAALSACVERLDNIDELSKLFEFVTKEIVFNEFKYYKPTKEVWGFYLSLLDREKELAKQIIPLIQSVQNSKLAEKSDASLSSTSVNRGIRNLGATCYINSTIQQLFHVPEFRQAILSSSSQEDDWFGELRYAFAKLALFPASFIDISNFIGKWRGYDNEVINPRVQQDSVEFLQLLMERLEQKIPHITDLFKGTIKHTTVREGETEEVANIEDFVLFPLEVKNCRNTNESMRNFLVPDEFDSVEDGKPKKMFRYHKIKETPPVLILQLKRFAYDIERGERLKINSKFDFPMELRLADVLDSEAEVAYDLTGVVIHTGTAQAGHYYSDVRSLNSREKWLCFNDTQVTKLSATAVLKDGAGGMENIQYYDDQYGYTSREVEKNGNAYLLFYRKRDTQAPLADSASIASFASMEVLSSRCQEVSDDLIRRLLPEIREAIFKDIFSSSGFADLIMKVCDLDETGAFLFGHFLNRLRSNIEKEGVMTMVTHLKDLCGRNKEFSETLLEKEAEFREFVIVSEKQHIRQAYADVILAAVNNSDSSVRTQFEKFLQDTITSADLLLMNSHCFPEFFDLCGQVCTRGSDAWLTRTQHFICIVLPAFVLQNKQESIYQRIDLRSLMRLLAIQVTDKNAGQIGMPLFDSPIFPKLWLTPTNSEGFLELMTPLLRSDQNKEFFSQKLCEENALPLPMMAKLFVVSLTLKDEQLLNAFHKVMSKKNASQVSLFFGNISSSEKIGASFAAVAAPWIKTFLCSPDKILRKAFTDFVLAVYSQDKTAAVDILAALNAKFDDLLTIAKLYNQRDTKVPDEKWPIRDYLSLMNEIIKKANLPSSTQQVTGDLLGLLRLCVVGRVQSQQIQIINFFRTLYGDNTFEVIPLDRFLKVFEDRTVHSQTCAAILSLITPSHTRELIYSALFPSLCLAGVKTSALVPFAAELRDERDAKRFAECIWTIQCFNNALTEGSSAIFQISWKLMRKFPALANTFESKEIHKSMWITLCKNSSHSRQMAKLLAVFNTAYAKVNEGKKSWFKKKTKALAEYYVEERFSIRYMMERAMKAPACKRPGDSGFYDFLLSMGDLRKKYKTSLLDYVMKMPAGRIQVLKPPKYAARFICRVCLEAGTPAALALLVSEFGSVRATEFEAVDEFCSFFKSLPSDTVKSCMSHLRKLMTNVPSLSGIGPHLGDVITTNWTAADATNIHSQVGDMLKTTISVAPSDAKTTNDILAVGLLLTRTFRFLSRLEEAFNISRVNLTPIIESCTILASLFNTEPTTAHFATLLFPE